MADPSGSDKSLLDRLRALNPNTSITQHARSPSQSPTAIHSLVIQPAKPPSREDALADRLRSLRENAENTLPSPGPPRPAATEAKSAIPNKSALPESPAPLRLSSSAAEAKKEPLAVGADTTKLLVSSQKEEPSQPAANEIDYENLLETDDGVLEDLLRDHADSDVGDGTRDWTFDPRAAAKEVDELMKKFQKLSRKDPDPDDNSEGEQMSRNVEKILAETLGDLKVHENDAGDDNHSQPLREGEKGEKGENAPGGSVGDVGGEEQEEPAWSLPSVPSEPITPSRSGQTPKAAPSTGNFDDDMLRRVAALRNPQLGGASADETDNPLGLPSVPQELPSAGTSRRKARGPSGRVGFTDADMETWCVACLEDGTLICPGCDDDVFCSQCWYDMHRGPSAGYEESLHKPIQFNRERKKNKKALIGAS